MYIPLKLVVYEIYKRKIVILGVKLILSTNFMTLVNYLTFLGLLPQYNLKAFNEIFVFLFF